MVLSRSQTQWSVYVYLVLYFKLVKSCILHCEGDKIRLPKWSEKTTAADLWGSGSKNANSLTVSSYGLILTCLSHQQYCVAFWVPLSLMLIDSAGEIPETIYIFQASEFCLLGSFKPVSNQSFHLPCTIHHRLRASRPRMCFDDRILFLWQAITQGCEGSRWDHYWASLLN